MESVHEKKKPYICSICEKKFAQKGGLEKHIERIHETVQPSKFKCSICNNNFSFKGDLKKHFENVHELKNLGKCLICNFKSFDLKRHMKRVHEVKQSKELK